MRSTNDRGCVGIGKERESLEKNFEGVGLRVSVYNAPSHSNIKFSLNFLFIYYYLIRE